MSCCLRTDFSFYLHGPLLKMYHAFNVVIGALVLGHSWSVFVKDTVEMLPRQLIENLSLLP